MKKVRALSCNIFVNKAIGDCSNGGISSRFNQVYVICPEGNWEIDLSNPDEIPENLVMSELVVFGGGCNVYRKFVPYKTKDKWSMMGGAFVYSSDCRFRDYFGDYPIPLCDRFEG